MLLYGGSAEDGVEAALEGKAVADHDFALADGSVGGLDGEREFISTDSFGQFEAGLAADDVGAEGFSGLADLAFGPAKGLTELPAGLPAAKGEPAAEQRGVGGLVAIYVCGVRREVELLGGRHG